MDERIARSAVEHIIAEAELGDDRPTLPVQPEEAAAARQGPGK